MATYLSKRLARSIADGKDTWQAYRNDLPDLRAVRAVALACGRRAEARALSMALGLSVALGLSASLGMSAALGLSATLILSVAQDVRALRPTA